MTLSNKLKSGLAVLALVCMGVRLKDMHTSPSSTQELSPEQEEILHEFSTMTLLPSLQNRAASLQNRKNNKTPDLALRGNTASRALSINLGGGKCEWTPPVDQARPVDPTFLVGYPGSCKRFSYKLMEALTGTWAGDDWDHSEHGYNVAVMKGAYPHHESSPWLWDKSMKQVVLQVRNPKWTFISYRSMRAELDYSRNWQESHDRIEYVYTFGGPIDHFQQWKANDGVQKEIKLWSWHIDFWMEGGLLRDTTDHQPILDGTGQPTYDVHCLRGGGTLDCVPKEVIVADNLEEDDGHNEMEKLAFALQGQTGVNVIDKEVWKCLFKEVVENGALKPRRFDPYRDQDGPLPISKAALFTSAELTIMRDEVLRMYDKYNQEPWKDMQTGKDLKEALKKYAELLKKDIEEAQKIEAGVVI